MPRCWWWMSYRVKLDFYSSSIELEDIDYVTTVQPKGIEDLQLTDILRKNRQLIIAAFDRMPDGPVSKIDGELSRDDLRALVHELEGMAGLEYARKQEVDIHPKMSAKERKAELDRVIEANSTVNRLARMWRALAELQSKDGPARSGWLELDTSIHKGAPVRLLKIRGRRDVAAGFAGLPTLFLDATMRVELLSYHWPAVELVADVAIEAPHQHIRQVTDNKFSKHKLAPHDDTMAAYNHREELLLILHKIAARYRSDPASVLAVMQKDVEDKLKVWTFARPFPMNLVTEHHNNVSGIDRYKDVDAVIVVGRTQPSPSAVEDNAMTLTGVAIDRVTKWYSVDTTGQREMLDGSELSAEVELHPDPIAEAFRWQICEGELLQIIGRARGIRRNSAASVDIWMLTDVVLPLPIEEALAMNDLRPSPFDKMIALGGIAFGSPADAAKAYPTLWKTVNAAELALRGTETTVYPVVRGSTTGSRGVSTDEGRFARFGYRRAAARGPMATATVDLIRHPNAEAALDAVIGPLSVVKRV